MQADSSIATAGGASRRPSFLRTLATLPASMLRPSEAGLKAAHFRQPWLAVGLLTPQLLILLFFFFIPSYKALSLAFVQVDPFGGLMIFVGLDNFMQLFNSADYRESAVFTGFFTLVTTVLTLVIAGVLAFATDFVIRGKNLYKSIILLPYAIAPVI